MKQAEKAAIAAEQTAMLHLAAREAEHAPVHSNVPLQQQVLSEVARRASSAKAATTFEQSADPQTKELRRLEAAGMLPQYLLDGAKFRDTILTAMPGLAQRVVDYMSAQAVVMFDQRGKPYVEVGDATKLLSPGQLKIFERLLHKFVPQQSEANQQGEQKNPNAPRNIAINIHQIGETPDYSKVPGSVDGIRVIRGGAAEQIATITIQPDPPAGGGNDPHAATGPQQAQQIREIEDAQVEYEEAAVEGREESGQHASSSPQRGEDHEDEQAGYTPAGEAEEGHAPRDS